MRRYWIEADLKLGLEFEITGDVFHHIFDVCRQDVGNHFELLCGDNKAYLVEVLGKSKKSGLVRVKEEREITPLPKPYIHLCVSLPKLNTFETILEKAVEMGVHSVHPFFSEFSFLRSAKKLSEGKLKRWQKIIQSATQQSGRGERMHLAAPESLDQLLEEFNRNDASWGLFPYEGPSSVSVKTELSALSQQQSPMPEHLYVFVGSEGGFSEQEVEQFQGVGLKPATLGEQVLRVETACLAVVSVIKYELDHWGK